MISSLLQRNYSPNSSRIAQHPFNQDSQPRRHFRSVNLKRRRFIGELFAARGHKATTIPCVFDCWNQSVSQVGLDNVSKSADLQGGTPRIRIFAERTGGYLRGFRPPWGTHQITSIGVQNFPENVNSYLTPQRDNVKKSQADNRDGRRYLTSNTSFPFSLYTSSSTRCLVINTP